MKKSRIILIIIFAVTAVAVLYFAYGVAKRRYMSPVKNGEVMQGPEIQNSAVQDQTGSQTQNETPGTPEATLPENTVPLQDNGQPVIQSKDCDNDCANFRSNPDYFKYCQEACGDRPVAPKESESQCENLTGIDKNACWRDLAVSKKDISICGKISDSKLLRVCRNRVTEEILN